MVSSVNNITNLVLSPVGITDINACLTTLGWHNPLRFEPYGGVESSDEQVTDILCRLPEFLGVLDFADEAVAKEIFGMFSESLVSPALYDDPSYYGSDSIQYIDTIHESLYLRYPSLEEEYEIAIDDGCCKSVRVVEFEGQFEPFGSFRLLAASVTFEETTGSEVYLAFHTPFSSYMFCSLLLVSQEISNDTGPGVVGYVYDAYAQGLSGEIGEYIDMEELEYADED